MKAKRCAIHHILLLCLLLVFACMATCPTKALATSEKVDQSRAIAIAYDTSGSMAQDSDKWCNAKYSLEVIAAMLDSKDTLDVYFMNYGINPAEPPLSVKGSDSIESRVKKVHDRQYRESLETVPNAAQEALAYLKGRTDASQRYLVITTDGAFTYTSDGREDGAAATQEIRDVVADAKANGIEVIYLAIGDDAQVLEDGLGAEVLKASSSDILSTMTTMANRLFGRASIPVNGNKITLDVPMSNLVVFAQGENVKVGSLSGNNEKVGAESATVRHNDKPFSSDEDNNRYNYKVNEHLKGVVASYNKDLARGEYELSVDGVEDNSLEVYYTPNVDIKVTLTDEFGDEHGLDAGEGGVELETGDYIVQMSLIDPNDGTPLESELLSGAQFSLEVNNGGTTQNVENGHKLNLQLGETSFAPDADVPGGVNVKRSYNNIKIIPSPGKLNVDASGVAASVPVNNVTNGKGTVTVSNEDGSDLTADEWQRMTLEAKSENGLNWDISKTDKPGVFEVTPTYGDEDAASLSARLLGGGPIGGYGSKDVATKFVAEVADEAHPLKGKADATTKVEPDIAANIVRNLVFYIPALIILWFLIMLWRKPKLPANFQPRIEVPGIPGTAGLVYKGVQNKIMPPWAPQKAQFSLRVRRGQMANVDGCYDPLTIKVIAVRGKGKGRRFKLSEDTVKRMGRNEEHPSGFAPEYSCIQLIPDKDGNMKAQLLFPSFGQHDSFTFEGKNPNRRGARRSETYTVYFCKSNR